MVVTRSRRDAEDAADQEELRVVNERLRRLTQDPPALPTVAATDAGGPSLRGEACQPRRELDEPTAGPSTAATAQPMRPRSPTYSHRSNASMTARLHMAELEAAEKLARIRRSELQLEAELITKRLAVQVASIRDEAESVQDDPLAAVENRVDTWLRNNPPTTRGEHGLTLTATELTQTRPVRVQSPPRRRSPTPVRRTRSPTPTRTMKGIEQLAEAIEKMARPRHRHAGELPTFSGAPSEWLPFKAAVRDSTHLYGLSAAENLQRLRACLKGEARDAVAALLHTATDPAIIMRTLEQCFGRPEIIIDRALGELTRLPKPGASATELNTFAVKLQNVVCVLKNIDNRGYLYNPLLAREVLEKLSPHIKSRWCDYAADHDGTGEPEIVTLSRFLMREADIALRYMYAPATNTTTSTATTKREARPAIMKKKTNAVYAVTEMELTDRCPNCNQPHALHRCSAYRALGVEQRWDMVRDKGLCFRCVEKRHRRQYCKAKLCGVNQCRRPHHPTLHEEPSQPAEQPATPPAASPPTAPKHCETVLSVGSLPTNKKVVLLKVVPVTVTGPLGSAQTYALLDEGATITLIDDELAQRIGAEGPATPLQLYGVNMAQREHQSRSVSLRLQGTNQEPSKIRARTVRDLRLHQQSIPSSLLAAEHLRDLEENVCYEQARPLLLIGTDNWELIVTRELRVGGPNEPAASRTQLGWVVHGTAPRTTILERDTVLHVWTPHRSTHENEQHDAHLQQLVEAHFRIDALGIAHRPRVSDADQRAIKMVNDTLKRVDGGYEVGLPWRADGTTMPPSYEAALRRLRTIERKMDADPAFAEQYTAQMENLFNKGYAVPCDGTEQRSAICWYLPHFAVQNPNKPGKQRLVFDAAHRSRGVSLNDQLLEGPDLLLSLQGILFRFRERPIAVTADIQEMFLRVKIRPDDQPAQQFLWRGNDRASPPRHYKMRSMIFGAASSPFMAHTVRDRNANVHAQTHPRALVAITQSHYMDDLVDSYDSEHDARATIQELREVHAAAGFTLRGWSSSHASVLRDVPEEQQATTPTALGEGENTEHKILGLYWNPQTDELGFNTAMHRVPADVRAQSRAPTKREALSAVMSIYDPLGLLSHYTIRAKIVLQSLWRLQLPWDEPIPAEEAELFTEWLQQLSDISRLRLRRSYTLDESEHIGLHVFCDASEQAYAAVAYWRAVRQDGSVEVTLVGAKAKVAPRRTQSIPRLELQAALIGARLADTIKREHRVKTKQVTYWTDSMTVAHWVRNDNRRYTPFVAHRLGEVAELTHPSEWRWLPTTDNVADDATRLYQSPIREEDRWFRGPGFLHEPEDQWPTERAPQEDEEEVLYLSQQDGSHLDWLPDPTRFSKFETLVRAAATVLAFIDICRKRATRLELRHVECAERALIQRAQEDDFGDELGRIKAARPIPRASRLYKLDPVIEDGLLRVRGRIEAATAPTDTKRPIILNGQHTITRLIVLREHSAAGHANRERVTNDLRQRYWIIRLRPTVRAVEYNCALCRVRKARPRPPATGDLPRARLDPFHRPFTNCGVDYFGPMMVKIGRRREKRWGALFTCLTTRAVHLELVATLSTDSALMALRRMAARRGWPRLMYSDNGTNFRGANQELKAAYSEWAPALRDEGLTHRMEWRFIAPGAPNQGGAWERMVRSVKTALHTTLREKAPTEETLRTLLTEAEYSINARPLTHVSVSPHDPEALTPNHFLLGTSTGLPRTGPCDEADRRAWRASQALADQFWRRWVREYLPTLVPRGEPATNGTPGLQVGDIVIVVDSTLPRNVWPMGVVERTYIGPDGGVRVADVRTRTGVFKRPTSKLAVLPREAAQVTPGGEMLRTPSSHQASPSSHAVPTERSSARHMLRRGPDAERLPA